MSLAKMYMMAATQNIAVSKLMNYVKQDKIHSKYSKQIHNKGKRSKSLKSRSNRQKAKAKAKQR